MKDNRTLEECVMDLEKLAEEFSETCFRLIYESCGNDLSFEEISFNYYCIMKDMLGKVIPFELNKISPWRRF